MRTPFQPAYIPRVDQGSILASDMLDLLLEHLSPETRPADPDSGNEYELYESTHDLCCDVFKESYSSDIKAVMDSVDEHVITIAQSANAVGKSHGAARIATAFLLRYRDAQVFTAAAPPESNLDLILWGQIRQLVHEHPNAYAKLKVTNSKYIERSPLSFMIGLPIPQTAQPHERKARFSGKHAPHILFVLDEGDAIPFDIYEAIESCMSGGHVRLLVMFNPRADVGPVSRMQKTGSGYVVKITAFNHPNVLTGENIYPGAVDRETTVRRINMWSRPLADGEKADSECFEVPDFLVGYVAKTHGGVAYLPLPPGYRRITDAQLSYMVLAQYPSLAENQLINGAAIDRAIERWNEYVSVRGLIPPIGHRPIMGGDIAEYGRDGNVCCLRYDDWVAPFELWNYTDPNTTANRLSGIYKNKRVSYANIDANGVGAGVAPKMVENRCREVYGLKMQSRPDMKTLSEEQKNLGEFDRLRDYIWWCGKVFIEGKDGMPSYAMIPGDADFIEDLKFAKYSMKTGNIKVTASDEFREKFDGRSPDKATAFVLACCDRFEEIAGVVSVENYIYGPVSVSHGNYVGMGGRS